jgi:hypothetical protein
LFRRDDRLFNDGRVSSRWLDVLFDDGERWFNNDGLFDRRGVDFSQDAGSFFSGCLFSSSSSFSNEADLLSACIFVGSDLLSSNPLRFFSGQFCGHAGGFSGGSLLGGNAISFFLSGQFCGHAGGFRSYALSLDTSGFSSGSFSGDLLSLDAGSFGSSGFCGDTRGFCGGSFGSDAISFSLGGGFCGDTFCFSSGGDAGSFGFSSGSFSSSSFGSAAISFFFRGDFGSDAISFSLCSSGGSFFSSADRIQAISFGLSSSLLGSDASIVNALGFSSGSEARGGFFSSDAGSFGSGSFGSSLGFSGETGVFDGLA